MTLPQLSDEQKSILAEIGRLHLVRESHRAAAKFCRDQIRQLRTQLDHLEQAAPQQA